MSPDVRQRCRFPNALARPRLRRTRQIVSHGIKAVLPQAKRPLATRVQGFASGTDLTVLGLNHSQRNCLWRIPALLVSRKYPFEFSLDGGDGMHIFQPGQGDRSEQDRDRIRAGWIFCGP